MSQTDKESIHSHNKDELNQVSVMSVTSADSHGMSQLLEGVILNHCAFDGDSLKSESMDKKENKNDDIAIKRQDHVVPIKPIILSETDIKPINDDKLADYSLKSNDNQSISYEPENFSLRNIRNTSGNSIDADLAHNSTAGKDDLQDIPTIKPLNETKLNMERFFGDIFGDGSEKFVGFQTASRKALPPISLQAKRRALAIFTEEQQPLDNETTKKHTTLPKNTYSSHISTATIFPKVNSPINPPKVYCDEANSRNPGEKGSPKQNTHPPAVIQNVFHDITNNSPRKIYHDQEKLFKPVTEVQLKSGFSTGGGKAIKPISEKAYRDAVLKFKQTEEATVIVNKSKPKKLTDPPYVGFRTGTGRIASDVSEEAKRRAETILSNDRELGPVSHNQSLSVTTTEKKANSLKDIKLNNNKRQRPEDSLKNPLATNVLQGRLLNKRRIIDSTVKAKPFKSPVINSKLAITKAAVYKKGSPVTSIKGQPVFNLQSPGPRWCISKLGRPIQYSRDTLLELGIYECLKSRTVHVWRLGT
ncbi:hypothetical protein J3Q64DRAFT_1171672 [Phycomyces blakesleeanus]|uniref:Inner centromere protein ARK-binding domain-containing protein n=1 Tax=Phycomyces blakesleeanus TaxID=4837 RepID=A0ABR3AY22_PHYBL